MTTKEDKLFFEAVKRNDEEAVKQFIVEKNIMTNITNFDQQTAAHIAAENGNLSLFKYLINHDRDLLEMVDKTERTVLHLAVKHGHLDIVKYLIDDLQLDILAEDNRFRGDTAVHIAAEEDQLEIVKYFLEGGRAHVSIKDGIGATPVFQAAERVRMRIVKYLVEERGADATHKDFQRDNILYRSAKNGDLTIPKYLLYERGVKLDVNWVNMFGRTLLHCATRFNNLDFIKFLIEEKNAEMNLSCQLGWTAMHEAACEGYIDIIKYLVSKGARIDLKDIQGKTPLDLAKETEVIEYLQNCTSTIRVRRDAFELHQYSSALTSNSHHFSDDRKQKMAISTSNRFLNHDGEEAFDTNLSHLGSVLLLANMIVNKSDHLSRTRNELPSPQQIVRNKIDSLAVEAIETNGFLN